MGTRDQVTWIRMRYKRSVGGLKSSPLLYHGYGLLQHRHNFVLLNKSFLEEKIIFFSKDREAWHV